MIFSGLLYTLLLLGALLVAESILRATTHRDGRTAISSLHGFRIILQQALADHGERIMAVGDSTLAGGGVARDDQIIAGRWKNALPPSIRFYNLTAPGGDTTMSLLLLDTLQREHVAAVRRVVIKVLLGKFYADRPTGIMPTGSAAATVKELQRCVTDLRPDFWSLLGKDCSSDKRLEARVQWELGKLSVLCRHQDFFRTSLTGNYPIYWLIGKSLPRLLMARLFPSEAHGSNGLAARLDDFSYDPANAPAAIEHAPRFTERTQGDYLEKCVALARQISAQLPVILVFPAHYECNRCDEAERRGDLEALAAFKTYPDSVAQRTGSVLSFVPSESFRNPRWWTRSLDHFSAEGSARIRESIEPRVRVLTPAAPTPNPP